MELRALYERRLTVVVRRVVVVVVLGLGLLMFGCAPEADPPTSSTSLTASASTTFPAPSTTTTSQLAEPGRVGLYRADPGTLEPVRASQPLTTGDSMWGSSSPNGEWLVLNVWYAGSPETDILRVINVQSGAVVTEAEVGAPQWGIDIADDGTVYRLAGNLSFRVEVITPGAEAFDDLLSLPERFSPWSSTEILSDHRLGWIGSVVSTDGLLVAAVGIADVASGDFDLYELPGVALEGTDQFDVGDWAVGEFYQPGVVWSPDDSKVYVVHADEPAVTVIDLTAGSVVEHDWAAPTAWLDRLAAFWNPVAVAKGPTAGAIASAALSPDGKTLYVSSEIGEFVRWNELEWHVEWKPQGIQAIDLATWEMVDTWDLPAAQVAVTPDGASLIGWGVTRKDTVETTIYTGHPVVVIDTETRNVVGEVDLPYDDLRLVSFSPDGSYVYFTQWDETYLSLDLSTNALVGTYKMAGGISGVFGETGLVAAPRKADS
jgi:DNA-binding beta-propeller fold protein YncE